MSSASYQLAWISTRLSLDDIGGTIPSGRGVYLRPAERPLTGGLRVLLGKSLTFISLCQVVGACMSSPQGALDTSEYSLDGPGFPTKHETPPTHYLPVVEPTVQEGRLEVVIDGVREELDTLTVAPPGSDPKPLAVISHGVPIERADARNIRLRRYLPIARNFARRGYRAVVFARRGFASSTGDLVGKPEVLCGPWPTQAYVEAARDSVNDYAAVIDAIADGPEGDDSRQSAQPDLPAIVAVGHSVGGLTVLALAERPPKGLVGVINIAGGHGGNGNRQVCNERALRRAFETFGRSARVPALWLYSTSDRYFWPSLTRRNFDAYVAGGAPARLEMLGPLWFTADGHNLVDLGGRELWQPRISTFLRDIEAPGWQLDPDLAPTPKPPAPKGLNAAGQRAWVTYTGSATHKAFAVGDDGWGYAIHRRTPQHAEEAALDFCRRHTPGCRIVAADRRLR